MKNVNYEIGQRIYASDRIVREILEPYEGIYDDGYRGWTRSEELYGTPNPVKGIYVGQRIYANEEGFRSKGKKVYERKKEFPVILIQENEYDDPTEVFPEDCQSE